jgi:hypothetical protein
MRRVVATAWIGAAVLSAVSASAGAAPTLPTLKLSAPQTVKVNHPYRVKASGETRPGEKESLFVFIRTGGKCKKNPTGEAMAGSYSAFGQTVTLVGPGQFSRRTPKTEFQKAHKHAKLCGFLEGQGLNLRVVRKIESVTGN